MDISVIQALGEQLKVKQQVISTAIVYFKRFYIRNPLKSIDPLLLAPTCIFLASKVEEFGVISNSRLIQTCQTVGMSCSIVPFDNSSDLSSYLIFHLIFHHPVKNKFLYAFPNEFPYRIQHVLECEFFLLELMDCCLILYHPYRPLIQFIQDMKDDKKDSKDAGKEKDEVLNLAWSTINDTYRTDIPLLYPPHLIAIGEWKLDSGS